jgi:hypothetical protein
MGGRPATERSPVAAGPNRSEVTSLETWRLVSDAVDAPVLAQQESGGDAALDRGGRDPRAQHFGAGGDAVRPVHQPGQSSLRCGIPGSHLHP